MLLHIPNVLTPKQVAECRSALDRVEWKDGKLTAGLVTKPVKNNMQVPADHPVARRLGEMIQIALNQNQSFIAAALPLRILPPMFNRYSSGESYGGHVDATPRQIWGSPNRIRTDLSATLFLSEPEDYDGGELIVDDQFGHRGVKLPPGDMFLYPSTSVHHVEPVTRGSRVAAFFWIQSMVREDSKRAVLFDVDRVLTLLGQHRPEHELPAADTPEHKALLLLSGVYYNLLRLWSDT